MQTLTDFTRTIADFKESRTQLVQLWQEGIRPFCPSEAQWNVWLELHDPATLMAAVLKTTKKFNKLSGRMDPDYLVRYMSSVANSLKGKNTTGTASVPESFRKGVHAQ